MKSDENRIARQVLKENLWFGRWRLARHDGDEPPGDHDQEGGLDEKQKSRAERWIGKG